MCSVMVFVYLREPPHPGFYWPTAGWVGREREAMGQAVPGGSECLFAGGEVLVGRGSFLRGGCLTAGPFHGGVAAGVMPTHAHWLRSDSGSRLSSQSFPSPLGPAYFELLKELPCPSSGQGPSRTGLGGSPQARVKKCRGSTRAGGNLELLRRERGLLHWLASPLCPRACSVTGALAGLCGACVSLEKAPLWTEPAS